MNEQQENIKNQLAEIAKKGYMENAELGFLSITKTYETMLELTDDTALICQVILQSPYAQDDMYINHIGGLIIK